MERACPDLIRALDAQRCDFFGNIARGRPREGAGQYRVRRGTFL
jgi:hypothetical protein